MKHHYLPTQDGERLVWLQNFAAKIGIYASKYGITAAEVADTTNAAAFLAYWLNIRNQTEENLHRIVAFKDELINGIHNGTVPSITPIVAAWGTAPTAAPAGIFVRVRAIVGKIKAQRSIYTLADAKDLGIEGEDIVIDTLNAKPEISFRIHSGHPEIIWKKYGMDGINIYVDRNNSGIFTYVNRNTKPNFIDNAPLPPAGQSAVWAYKVIYVKNDEEVGLVSDVLIVTVSGWV